MSTIEVRVPAIGDVKDVGVVEVLVKPGDVITREQGVVTLESEKATMDVPAPAAGTVRELKVAAGDRVKEGSLLLLLEVSEAAARPAASPPPAVQPPAVEPPAVQPAVLQPAVPQASAPQPVAAPPPGPLQGAGTTHASPSVRRFARELGVELPLVEGTGPRGRILQGDVQRFVKGALAGGATARGAGLDLLPWPRIDFAAFGPVERQPLTRIRKLTGANLSRNWVMIPHVTQFDEADITELEAFRVKLNTEQSEGGPKLTMLAFLVKACVVALREFPTFNSSLDGDALVLKRYFHVGFAADTPNGLVVPVLRDADRKGLVELARELGDLAAKARAGRLTAAEMQGGCFTISSLGGIGGTAFTPIVNAPEVAILGVSRSGIRPAWDGVQFQPRLMLPLSLSYDHRVIDGAAGARFTSFLAKVLGDARRLLL